MTLTQLYLERERIQSLRQKHLSALEALEHPRQENLRAINAALKGSVAKARGNSCGDTGLEHLTLEDFPEYLDKA